MPICRGSERPLDRFSCPQAARAFLDQLRLGCKWTLCALVGRQQARTSPSPPALCHIRACAAAIVLLAQRGQWYHQRASNTGFPVRI
jgi:hypothetical protein